MAECTVKISDLQCRIGDLSPVLCACIADCTQCHTGRLIAVHGIRLGILPKFLAIPLYKLTSLASELFWRQSSKRYEATPLQIRGASRINKHLLAASIRHHQECINPSAGHIFGQLAAFALRCPTKINKVGLGGLDGSHQRFKFLRLRVDRIVPKHLDTDLVAAFINEVGKPFPVNFIVI